MAVRHSLFLGRVPFKQVQQEHKVVHFIVNPRVCSVHVPFDRVDHHLSAELDVALGERLTPVQV